MGKPGPHLILFKLCPSVARTKAHHEMVMFERRKREIKCGSSPPEYIGRVKRTQGTETSKYLKEKKSTEIP